MHEFEEAAEMDGGIDLNKTVVGTVVDVIRANVVRNQNLFKDSNEVKDNNQPMRRESSLPMISVMNEDLTHV